MPETEFVFYCAWKVSVDDLNKVCRAENLTPYDPSVPYDSIREFAQDVAAETGCKAVFVGEDIYLSRQARLPMQQEEHLKFLESTAHFMLRLASYGVSVEHGFVNAEHREV